MRYFHISSRSSRESIAAHGLDATRGESAYEGIEYLQGNYLFTDLDAATAYRQVREDEEADEYGMNAQSYDLWQIEADLIVQLDEFIDDESGLGAYSVVTTTTIPASALQLI